MENRRFLRTEALLGHEGMERLRGARVMVVGLGAVGGYALEALVRAGVGHLTLVDFDVFDESNINRQILALSSTVGRRKTEVARERVLDINPDCDVKIIETFVNADTLRRIPSEQILLKYVRLYAQEPTCARLQEALMSQRWEDAFREAHSLKGVAQTLGFTHLYEVCSVLADALRPGRPLLDMSLWDNVQRAHLEVLGALSLLTNPE